MLQFEHTYMLYFLGILPILVLMYWLYSFMRKKRLNQFVEKKLQPYIMPDLSKRKPKIKFVLLLTSLFMIIIATANLQHGSKLEKVKRKGVDLIIALDVSNSMLAEDIKPNRLEKAKRSISQLLKKLTSDRISIIVFGGDAYTQLPITTDYAAAEMLLDAVSTDIIPTQGTAIGAAIQLGIETFKNEAEKNKTSITDKRNKAIIVITDGENHEDDAIEQAKEASNIGIVVHTIGMGLPQGGPIPLKKRGNQVDYRKNSNNEVIITRLNETMLQQIATAGNGMYIGANNTSTGIKKLFDEINKMDKQELGTSVYTDFEDRFQYFLLPAILFLILEIFIFNKKSKLSTFKLIE